MSENAPNPPAHFIRTRIRQELEAGKHDRVVTRFPPEPNGYLHIGHAKSIVLNFAMAKEFGGETNLRFDDTNPIKEEQRYVDAIREDVAWLGYKWARECYASDYFPILYEYALHLIDNSLAYVDSQDADEIRAQRGTLTEPGTASPHRDRDPAESRDLFVRMRAGEFPDGAHVLRAKIDMAAPNINMRDPVLYRIRHQRHPRTGDEWCIYPSYDFAHGQSDAIEGITHSLCTLEFEDHRPLYDWLIEHLPVPSKPQQIEFSRLNLDFTVLSKRRLMRLVDEGFVDGWDDPRMPTFAGIRRRGFTPRAIRNFCNEIGVTKSESIIPFGAMERNLRDDLNERAPRRMAVLEPVKVVLTNFPEGETEWFEAANHPQNPELGKRKVPMTREIWIEREDFMEDAPKKFFRLKPGGEVRLRNAFIIRCDKVVKSASGDVEALHWQLRSRIALGPARCRSQGQGHDPLGLGRACRGSRSAALRPPVLGAAPGRRQGTRLRRTHQSRIAADHRLCAAGTRPGKSEARRALPVRAHRLLRRRSRFKHRKARLEPGRHAARHLGQAREAMAPGEVTSAVRRTRPPVRLILSRNVGI